MPFNNFIEKVNNQSILEEIPNKITFESPTFESLTKFCSGGWQGKIFYHLLRKRNGEITMNWGAFGARNVSASENTPTKMTPCSLLR